MAPTLRFHAGVFYVIFTNMCVGKSFICTAQNPAGPWSEPHWLTDVPGIDPSLFFDMDGRAYITGLDTEEYAGGSRQVIWVSELDLKAMRLTGERPVIWRGALRNARYPEGPHLYRRGGWYYLLSAEGGTEHYHSVVVGRSREIFSEFENYNGNPVLTHRHLGRSYPFCNIGHADLVELLDGRWYAVLLGSRLVNGVGTPLGRETFLVPVAWEDDWPVFSPGTGKVERQYPLPFEQAENSSRQTKAAEFSVRDDFTFGTLPLHWAAYGTPYTGFYTLDDNGLTIPLSPEPIWRELTRVGGKPVTTDNPVPSLLIRRRQHLACSMMALMIFTPQAENETAGLIVMTVNNHMLRLERTIRGERHVIRAAVCSCVTHSLPYLPDFTASTTETFIFEEETASDAQVILEIKADGTRFTLSAGANESSLAPLVTDFDGGALFPENCGMVGTYLGMYASSNGTKSDNAANYKWFEYKGEQ
jgi:alpha-N-arabinofuranosidase